VLAWGGLKKERRRVGARGKVKSCCLRQQKSEGVPVENSKKRSRGKAGKNYGLQ